MNDIHVDGWLLSMIGGVLSFLLLIIAYFLDRLIKQFDGLATQFKTLNDTMLKIDGELSGEVGVLKNQQQDVKSRLDKFDTIWDRMRTAESDIVGLKSSCIAHKDTQ